MASNSASKPNLRPPAPSLFVGPPSRNASSTSLQPNPTAPTRAPLVRQHSLLSQKPLEAPEDSKLTPSASKDPLTRRQQQQQQVVEEQSNKRTDAIWAEMQNTLEEVELSATGNAHVFGANHAKSLDELRAAQIALAQAWARSEAEEEGQEEVEKAKNAKQDKAMGQSSLLASDRVDKLEKIGTSTGRARGESEGSTGSRGKTELEEDTQNDITLARKRREANDKYFSRVNSGVLDVVAKLEEVAKAMKSVEQESKEIWGDGESMNTNTTASVT